jgi:ABC-2 type transport system ATP-binding protein
MPGTIIEIEGLSKRYGSHMAVENLTLTVRAGDVYGFLGPNGAGKSTTIRMITGLIRPGGGTARIMNLDIRDARAMQGVGALVESPSFYGYLSARQNLELFSGLSGGCGMDRIERVLRMAGLADRADDKVKSFSHGMRQRLGIAQALLPEPRLVILDEPTDGLDPQGMRDVRRMIRGLADEGVTVFLSSHLLFEVEQVCTRVGIINRGRLEVEGDVKSLLSPESGSAEIRVSDVEPALRVLQGVPGVRVLSSGGGSLFVEASPDAVAEANKALLQAGIKVYAIIPKSSSLEDLFLQITEGGREE